MSYCFSSSSRYLLTASLTNSARDLKPYFRFFKSKSISRISSSGIGTLAYPSGYSFPFFIDCHGSSVEHIDKVFCIMGVTKFIS